MNRNRNGCTRPKDDSNNNNINVVYLCNCCCHCYFYHSCIHGLKSHPTCIPSPLPNTALTSYYHFQIPYADPAAASTTTMPSSPPLASSRHHHHNYHQPISDAIPITDISKAPPPFSTTTNGSINQRHQASFKTSKCISKM